MFTDTCDAWRITNLFSSQPLVMRDLNNRSKYYSILFPVLSPELHAENKSEGKELKKGTSSKSYNKFSIIIGNVWKSECMYIYMCVCVSDFAWVPLRWIQHLLFAASYK